MQRLSKPRAAIRPAYDVVVVGSGYGGGVAASRLSRAGLKVCVLERGKEFPTGSFPNRLPELRRELQITGARVRSGSPTGLFDFRLGEDMHVLVGCGLGGGSLINAGVALEPDPRVFADAAWPHAIAADGLLAEGYRRARAMLRPARHAEAGHMPKYRALEAASPALGKAPVPAPVNVSFEATVNPAGVSQPACTLCGDCCSGCNVGAKNTIAMTYLPDAVVQGAELFAEVRVSHVAKDAEGWRVHLAPDHREQDAPAGIAARIVVLAAGTLGSTELLLRSRERGLEVSDRLGEGFSANGDIIAFALGGRDRTHAVGIGHPQKLEEVVGACVSGQIELTGTPRLEDEMTVQEGVLPSALAPLLPVFFLSGGRLLSAAESLIKGVYRGPLAHLATYFVVSHDAAQGRFTLEDDRLVLRWPGVASDPVYARVDAALQALAAEAGGRYIKSPLAATASGTKPATAHPLGGCGMGRDASHGVVDHKGRVFDGREDGTSVHDGLYVVDGATIPRSLGVNPLLTITALAERAMLHLARDHNLGLVAEPVAAEVPAVAVLAGLMNRE